MPKQGVDLKLPVIFLFLLLAAPVGFTWWDLKDSSPIVVREFRELNGVFPREAQISLHGQLGRQKRRVVILRENFRVDVRYPAGLATRAELAAHKFNYLEVPAGFVSDFASVPFPLDRIISPFGWHAEAAIVHDWLYAIGEPGNRRFADQLFFELMKEKGVNPYRRAIMYTAVRIGGSRAYTNSNEWYGSFVEPYTLEPMPRECLWDRPKTGRTSNGSGGFSDGLPTLSPDGIKFITKRTLEKKGCTEAVTVLLVKELCRDNKTCELVGFGEYDSKVHGALSDGDTGRIRSAIYSLERLSKSDLKPTNLIAEVILQRYLELNIPPMKFS